MALKTPSFAPKWRLKKTANIAKKRITFSEWCETLKIKTPRGIEPFALYDWQRDTSDLIVGDRAVIGRPIFVLSSRQTGKTSLFLSLGGYEARVLTQFSTVYVHRTGADSTLLARRLKRFLYGERLKTDSLRLLELENDSMLHFRSANPSRGEEGAEGAGRGLDSIDRVYYEESCFLQNLKDVIGVLGPTLTQGRSRVSVFISTAGSRLSHFYDQLALSAGGADNLENLLQGIRDGREEPFQILNLNGEGPIGVISNWRCIPEFAAEPDFLGRIKKELGLSDDQIAREYEMHFSAGDVDEAVFDFTAVLDSQVETLPEPGTTSLYWGVDPSGQGKDYAVAIALEEYEPGRYQVVHLYRKRSGTTEQHIAHIVDLTKEIGAQRMLVEKNSMGVAWAEALELNADCFDGVERWHTSEGSKAGIIGRLNLAIEMGVLKIPKGPIINELLAFRRDAKGRMAAPSNGHDDCVMALAMALHCAGFNAVQREALEKLEEPPDDDGGNFRPVRRLPLK